MCVNGGAILVVHRLTNSLNAVMLRMIRSIFPEDTYSTTAIASPGAHQTLYGGAGDDMLIKFIECWPIAAAGPITGPATIHRNSSGIPYSIPPLAHAANYIWTLPPGNHHCRRCRHKQHHRELQRSCNIRQY